MTCDSLLRYESQPNAPPGTLSEVAVNVAAEAARLLLTLPDDQANRVGLRLICHTPWDRSASEEIEPTLRRYVMDCPETMVALAGLAVQSINVAD